MSLLIFLVENAVFVVIVIIRIENRAFERDKKIEKDGEQSIRDIDGEKDKTFG